MFQFLEMVIVVPVYFPVYRITNFHTLGPRASDPSLELRRFIIDFTRLVKWIDYTLLKKSRYFTHLLLSWMWYTNITPNLLNYIRVMCILRDRLLIRTYLYSIMIKFLILYVFSINTLYILSVFVQCIECRLELLLLLIHLSSFIIVWLLSDLSFFLFLETRKSKVRSLPNSIYWVVLSTFFGIWNYVTLF